MAHGLLAWSSEPPAGKRAAKAARREHIRRFSAGGSLRRIYLQERAAQHLAGGFACSGLAAQVSRGCSQLEITHLISIWTAAGERAARHELVLHTHAPAITCFTISFAVWKSCRGTQALVRWATDAANREHRHVPARRSS